MIQVTTRTTVRPVTALIDGIGIGCIVTLALLDWLATGTWHLLSWLASV